MGIEVKFVVESTTFGIANFAYLPIHYKLLWSYNDD